MLRLQGAPAFCPKIFQGCTSCTVCPANKVDDIFHDSLLANNNMSMMGSRFAIALSYATGKFAHHESHRDNKFRPKASPVNTFQKEGVTLRFLALLKKKLTVVTPPLHGL